MTITETEITIVMLPVDELVPGFDFRLDDNTEDLAELAASIAEHGVLQPLVVRSSHDQWEVVAGRRRLAASRQAGLDHVPCIIRTLTEDQATDTAIAENLHRRNLSPIEEALAFAHLKKTGLKQREIARRVGRHETHVCNLLKLLDLPADVRADIHSGRLSYTTALRTRYTTGQRQGGGFIQSWGERRRGRARVVLAPASRPCRWRAVRDPEGAPGRCQRGAPDD